MGLDWLLRNDSLWDWSWSSSDWSGSRGSSDRDWSWLGWNSSDWSGSWSSSDRGWSRLGWSWRGDSGLDWTDSEGVMVDWSGQSGLWSGLLDWGLLSKWLEHKECVGWLGWNWSWGSSWSRSSWLGSSGSWN